MTSGSHTPLARLGFRALTVRVDASDAGREFNPLCRLVWPDRPFGGEQARVYLDTFLGDNDGTLSISEIQSICDHLLARKVYEGGGGAAERWTLEVAK